MNKVILFLVGVILVGCNSVSRVVDCADGCSDDTETVVVEVPRQKEKFTCTAYDASSASSLSSIPSSAGLTKVATVKVDVLNNPNVNENQSLAMFLGTPAESLQTKFLVECEGKLKVTQEGTHVLNLYSDDGSDLRLNNVLVVSRDGLRSYSRTSSNVNLAAGEYNLKLRYFQNLSQKGLALTVRLPGSSFEQLLTLD